MRSDEEMGFFFLGVSGGILGTCFLHTTGHTPTGQWDHAALRTEHMNNKMKCFAFIRQQETTEQTRPTHSVARGRYIQYSTMYEELTFGVTFRVFEISAKLSAFNQI